MEQNEPMSIVSLERFLTTLREAAEKETDTEKKSTLENNISDVQTIEEKRTYINTLQEKIQNLETEMQQILSQVENAEDTEENTQKANEFYTSFMEIQAEYGEKMEEIETIFSALSPEHIQILEEYFIQDLIDGVTKAQPDIDGKLIADIINEIFRAETQVSVPDIAETPLENDTQKTDTPSEE